MAHIIVPEAEDILDKDFPVLDKGCLSLIDYLGGDARIAQAARTSTGKQNAGKTTKDDWRLINRLMKDEHTSPFEQVELVFFQKLPIFVARQQIRHRTASVNEWSGRYSVLANEFYVPGEGDIRFQSNTNKQGRSEDEVPPELRQKVLDLLIQDQENAYASYQEMLTDKISRELARINLPVSIYTQWYWKVDLHNLFRFLRLRLDPHAQKEIRLYAKVMAAIAKKVAPVAYDAFEEHVLYAVKFSQGEMLALRQAADGTAFESRICDLLGPKEGAILLAKFWSRDTFCM